MITIFFFFYSSGKTDRKKKSEFVQSELLIEEKKNSNLFGCNGTAGGKISSSTGIVERGISGRSLCPSSIIEIKISTDSSSRGAARGDSSQSVEVIASHVLEHAGAASAVGVEDALADHGSHLIHTSLRGERKSWP